MSNRSIVPAVLLVICLLLPSHFFVMAAEQTTDESTVKTFSIVRTQPVPNDKDPAEMAAYFAPNSTNWKKRAPVFMQLRMNHLDNVDGVTKSFEADFYLMMAAPILNVLSATMTPGDITPVADLPAALKAQVTPVIGQYGFDFENSNDYTKINDNEYIMASEPDWMVVPWEKTPDDVMLIPPKTFAYFFRYRRYKAKFRATLPLHDFPFDKQNVNVDISMNIPRDFIQVIPMAEQNFVSRMEGLLQWTLLDFSTMAFNKTFDGIPNVFSGLRFQVSLKRIPNYYYLKIISGICMIVFMNFLLFALPIEDSNRIAVSATLFLAIVAYLFLVSNDVPKVAYATRLDDFVLLSMMDIFISVVFFQITVTVNRIAVKCKEDADEEWSAQLEADEAALNTYERKHSDDDDDEDRNNGKKKKTNPVTAFEEPVSANDERHHNDPASPSSTSKVKAGSASSPKRPEDMWFDTWIAMSRKSDAVQAAIVILVFVIGAPVILWG